MKELILQQFEHFANSQILDGLSPIQLSYATGFKAFLLPFRADMSYFQGCILLSHCDLKIVILPQFFLLWIFKKLVRSSSLMAVGSCPLSRCFLASPMSWSRECRTDASRLAYSAVLRIKLQRATGKCCWRHHVLAANVWPFCTQ